MRTKKVVNHSNYSNKIYSENASKSILLLVEIVGVFALLIHSLIINKPPIFDEHFYIDEVALINKLGISLEFLTSSKVAVGPLTAVIHYFFQPFTNLEAPGIRIINVILLILIIAVLTISLNFLSSKKPLVHSCGIMGIPMTWVISGMSLSEIPAMFFASTGMLLLLLSIESENSGYTKGFKNITAAQRSFISALGGLLFGLSVLGRQTFIVILFALPILVILNRKNIRYTLSFIIFALILPVTIFIIWGGLVPPHHIEMPNYIDKHTFSVTNGFLSFAYIGMTTLIIAPRWFYFGKKTLPIFLAVVTFTTTVNTAFNFVNITPAASIIKNILSAGIIPIYSDLISSCLISIGILFILSSLKIIFKRKNDYIFIFLCVSLLLVCATPFKIVHLFSSRYVATAIPLLLLVTDRYSSENFWKTIRVTVGSLLGFIILRSFFIVH